VAEEAQVEKVNPHQVTRDFEAALCAYTGARFAVAVNSCTSALMLAVHYTLQRRPDDIYIAGADHIGIRPPIEIPRRTYVSVPMAIIHAGGRPAFRDEAWLGLYQLKPLSVWDCARWFTGGMYDGCLGQMYCVSFHWTKHLGVEFDQGGAILHDSPEADSWFRRARFDGRTEGVAPKDDHFDMIGWHCYMNPTTAQRLLKKMQFLPRHNAPLKNDEYPNLSLHEAFK